MKWKGTVSQRANMSIATRLASENTAHAMSTHSSLTRPSGQERQLCKVCTGRARQLRRGRGRLVTRRRADNPHREPS